MATMNTGVMVGDGLNAHFLERQIGSHIPTQGLVDARQASPPSSTVLEFYRMWIGQHSIKLNKQTNKKLPMRKENPKKSGKKTWVFIFFVDMSIKILSDGS